MFTRKPRILVVENDTDWLRRADEALRGENYEVRTATTAAEAEQILAGGEGFDVAVFDLHLHPDEYKVDRTGLRLARKVPHLMRILCTAVQDDGSLTRDVMKEGIEIVFKTRDALQGLTDAVRAALAKRVFLIHGHDGSKNMISWFLKSNGLWPIVLADQPGGSRTLIEVLEKYSGVQCAIAVLTPDDEGRLRGTADLKPRARQNVIFELGYFSAALGRDKVFVLCDESVERPSDYGGIRYIPLDAAGAWHARLAQDLRTVGVQITVV
jgi:predicted nucleotide-binding protein